MILTIVTSVDRLCCSATSVVEWEWVGVVRTVVA